MSTTRREKLARQRQHQLEKEARMRKSLLGSPITQKKERVFKEYKGSSSPSYVRDTKEYPSLEATGRGYHAKMSSKKYTGDLIEGIGTMHKSNAVPIMKGTSQAEDIAKMRR
jgi:hypothetical protein